MRTKKEPEKAGLNFIATSISDLPDINHFFSDGQCLYIPPRKSITYAFSVKTMPVGIYETIISEGFRRNGFYFYQNFCPECCSCIPIRVDVQNFRLSKSQRRVLRKNQDVTIIRNPAAFDQEGFLLYQKYCRHRHNSLETKNDYTRFLIDSPVPTDMMRYYVGDNLMGIGWIDVLPDSLSSVYFAFDPSWSFRSPGVLSMLKEIELCRELQKKWLYMGFWIKENKKMSYKNQYKPCQILENGYWRELVSNQ